MTHIRWEFIGASAFWLALLVAFALYVSGGAQWAPPVVAAEVEPMATATPATCALVAMAGKIEIRYCEDIHLFVNQLGFMAFEP